MSAESETTTARQKLANMRLNQLQRRAVATLTQGMDYSYVVQGGPGTGKSVVLARVALILEQRNIWFVIVSVQRAVANNYAALGLNATSVAAWLCEPELGEGVVVNVQFRRRHGAPKNHAVVMLLDEYAFASANQIQMLINSMSAITTGPTQLLMFGDVGQLEKPSVVGQPAVCHSLFSNPKKLRACVLTDSGNRFVDADLRYLVDRLRNLAEPIGTRAERILQSCSYMATMWQKTVPDTTLCMTNHEKDRRNKAQWRRADPSNRVVVDARGGPRTQTPRPAPSFLVYDKEVMFSRPYWPRAGATDQRPIANGEMGVLVSGPRGRVTASKDITFVVCLANSGTTVVVCNRTTAGEHEGWVESPIVAVAGVTMAKLQGQTLDNITVDLQGCGRVETMVAVSRGRKLDTFDGTGGVRIVNYEPGTADNLSRISPSVVRAVAGFSALEAKCVGGV